MMTFNTTISTAEFTTVRVLTLKDPIGWVFHDRRKVAKRTMNYSFQIGLTIRIET